MQEFFAGFLRNRKSAFGGIFAIVFHCQPLIFGAKSHLVRTSRISAVLAERLIIEVDGGHHTEAHELKYDARRDAYLEENGYRVLRVTNSDVMHRIDGVLETIRASVTNISSPTHGPSAGGA